MRSGASGVRDCTETPFERPLTRVSDRPGPHMNERMVATPSASPAPSPLEVEVQAANGTLGVPVHSGHLHAVQGIEVRDVEPFRRAPGGASSAPSVDGRAVVVGVVDLGMTGASTPARPGPRGTRRDEPVLLGSDTPGSRLGGIFLAYHLGATSRCRRPAPGVKRQRMVLPATVPRCRGAPRGARSTHRARAHAVLTSGRRRSRVPAPRGLHGRPPGSSSE